MSWQQLHIIIPAEQVELFENQLMDLGALSITLKDALDEPIFEPEIGTSPVWNKTKLTALFNLDHDIKQIEGQIQSLHPDQFLNTKSELVPDEDWERSWLKYFKPMQFGDNFWIVPTGYDIPDPKAINLMLDPGLAFGTGTHPTTAMCLQWLAQHPPHNKTVIDYGCGSGILAIAALLLGAKQVWAIDYDPQALVATKNNAKRNHLDLSKLQLGKNADLPDDYQAEIILANILANPLIQLAPTLCQHLNEGGKIVLSGILEQQTEPVITTYQKYISIDAIEQQADWICLAGHK